MTNRQWLLFGLAWLFLLVGCITVTVISSPAPVQITLVAAATLTPDVPEVTRTRPITGVIVDGDCNSNNLIACSLTVPINISFTKLSSGQLVADFNNVQRGSGLAFQFYPPLDVSRFQHLEIHGASTATVTFMVEYQS